ncbi:hypothetical protein BJV74DRAFT_839603 [Russula compacta]|nr:hypothetical protein BJV74DRAFT_839603 [Russula compacta]
MVQQFLSSATQTLAVLRCVTVISGAPPPESTTPLARWLAPLTALAGTLDLQDVTASDALTKIVEQSVRAQVPNVADAAPEELWVHCLVYEPETDT